MVEVRILQMPLFRSAYKKLHRNQKTAVDHAVATLVANPERGKQKKGELAGVWVDKFDCVHQEYLLAYAWDPQARVFLALGVHENFYRDLKH
jgi:hypothetical protein